MAFVKSVFRKLFFIRVRTFSNTNLEMSKLIKGKTRSVPVDDCVSQKWIVKSSLLNVQSLW